MMELLSLLSFSLTLFYIEVVSILGLQVNSATKQEKEKQERKYDKDASHLVIWLSFTYTQQAVTCAGEFRSCIDVQPFC